MPPHLDLKNIALLGRSFEEYRRMFSLDHSLLETEKILDVASGVSSFCAEACEKGYNVTASDRIYGCSPDDIGNKCRKDLEAVLAQMPGAAGNYNWEFFRDIPALEKHRKAVCSAFIRDFIEHGTGRYVPVDYPDTAFANGEFTMAMVSHFLFLYDKFLGYDFHRKTLLELARITSGEIRIFPVVNLRGERSKMADAIMHDSSFTRHGISIQHVDYEFMKNANEMMVITINK